MMSRHARRQLGWIFIVAVVAVSLMPPTGLVDAGPGDKFWHALTYAGLMAWWLTLATDAWRLATLFLVMGLCLEIAQALGGHRHGDIFDMAANAIGIAIGWAGFVLAARTRPT